jgi:endonuclease YncB( thermonuclease family)
MASSIIIATCFLLATDVAQPIAPETIRVIDGDAIALKGSGPHIRLVGFNAPETRNAECQEEAALGQRAKQRLRQIVAGGTLDLTVVRCSCEPGTEETQWYRTADRRGRRV